MTTILGIGHNAKHVAGSSTLMGTWRTTATAGRRMRMVDVGATALVPIILFFQNYVNFAQSAQRRCGAY